MKAIDLPAVNKGGGAALFRRRLVDEIEVPSEGRDSDHRRLFMLHTLATQPDLWRIPQTPGFFTKMRLEWISGYWTIELEKAGRLSSAIPTT